tara:strand:- start:10 stop:534 length:525 start_codon:yes stop_codon:yes gene_type:complete
MHKPYELSSVSAIEKLQRKLLDVAKVRTEIREERKQHRRDEFEKAESGIAELTKKIDKESKLVFLRDIKFDLGVGKEVTGTMKESGFINLGGRGDLISDRTSNGKFKVINVHTGRKHLGVHIRYTSGKHKGRTQWVPVNDFAQGHLAKLDNGKFYERAVSDTRHLVLASACENA